MALCSVGIRPLILQTYTLFTLALHEARSFFYHLFNILWEVGAKVIAILANMMEEGGENMSPTPAFKHPRRGEVDSVLTKEGCSTSILKHIGIMEEDDLEVFVDVLNDRPVTLSPTPLRNEESRTLSLTSNFTLLAFTKNTKRVEDPTVITNDCHDLNMVSKHPGNKSFARRKTQQGNAEVPSFNLWRSFKRTTKEDTSNHNTGNTPYPPHPSNESTPIINWCARHK